MDGAHTVERCAEVTIATLRATYEQLSCHRVALAATLLKPNMVLPGMECPTQVDDNEIAKATLTVLSEAVPAAVPGIVFLSGGQSDEQATARLSAINGQASQPWELSFSYGRALQAPVLRAWAGDEANRAAAQSALLHRARLNTAARYGSYQPDLEQVAAARH
jgi:fructose-bisphosphate aldolase, class I